jgi:hypothetical protein
LADGNFKSVLSLNRILIFQGFLVRHRQAESQEGVQADSRCQAHQPRNEVNKDYFVFFNLILENLLSKQP